MRKNIVIWYQELTIFHLSSPKKSSKASLLSSFLLVWSPQAASCCYIACHNTDVRNFACFRVLLCLMLVCLCCPFIQPFVTPQFPDLSCEPHWPSWCTDLSWVRCEIWVCCMCEYACAFIVSVYFTFPLLFSYLFKFLTYVLFFWNCYAEFVL